MDAPVQRFLHTFDKDLSFDFLKMNRLKETFLDVKSRAVNAVRDKRLHLLPFKFHLLRPLLVVQDVTHLVEVEVLIRKQLFDALGDECLIHP